jgi:hypothetical protein
VDGPAADGRYRLRETCLLATATLITGTTTIRLPRGTSTTDLLVWITGLAVRLPRMASTLFRSLQAVTTG